MDGLGSDVFHAEIEGKPGMNGMEDIRREPVELEDRAEVHTVPCPKQNSASHRSRGREGKGRSTGPFA